jgi:hypothetical protein
MKVEISLPNSGIIIIVDTDQATATTNAETCIVTLDGQALDVTQQVLDDEPGEGA